MLYLSEHSPSDNSFPCLLEVTALTPPTDNENIREQTKDRFIEGQPEDAFCREFSTTVATLRPFILLIATVPSYVQLKLTAKWKKSCQPHCIRILYLSLPFK